MSNERLQEYFSELHEGTLDEAIAQQIKYRLEVDENLKLQYNQFLGTLSQLQKLPNEEIPIPINLSTKIADRLAEEATAKPKWSLISFFKPAFAIGIVAALSFGTYTAMKGQQSKTVNASMTASPTPSLDYLDEVRVDQAGDSVIVRYNSSGPKTLKISSLETNTVLKQYDLDGDAVVLPLQNDQATASAFSISASGETVSNFVVIPGKDKTTELKGTGKLIDLAKVLSNQFQSPIHLKIASNMEMTWDISQKSLLEAASAAFDNKNFKISQKGKSLLEITSIN